MKKFLFDSIFCQSCHKFFDVANLEIIDGMAWCPGGCGGIHVLDHNESLITAKNSKSGDRERRV